ncbi:MAG: porin [Nitrospirota bacterium]|nr:porin [Nitrospirota bacterium]
MRRLWLATVACVIGLGLIAQANSAQANLEDILYEKGQITKEEWLHTKADHEKEEAIIAERASLKKWYDKISIRGYTQMRYSYLTGENDLRSEYDSSIGNNTGFLFRRVRLVISGDITDWLSIYLQPDFGAGAGAGNNNFTQLRDAYADIFLPFLSKDKEFRIRAGQSKVPFGFENLQSSQNRLALDRSDGINSAANGERDMGFFLYYAPADTRKLFRRLVDTGLKGSGDYGVLGVGVYNGQTLNVTEANDNKHVVLHATYPFELPYGQIVQVGVDAYRGLVNVAAGAGVTRPDGGNINDERIGAHFVLYPQPFGLQAEWNWGRGPELNAAQTALQEGSLQGGYVQAMYKWDDALFAGNVAIPYVRWQEYNGGKKHRTNSPFNVVRELEVGLEYQFSKALELTVAYAWMKRTDTQNAPYPIRDGEILRTQLQWNF